MCRISSLFRNSAAAVSMFSKLFYHLNFRSRVDVREAMSTSHDLIKLLRECRTVNHEKFRAEVYNSGTPCPSRQACPHLPKHKNTNRETNDFICPRVGEESEAERTDNVTAFLKRGDWSTVPDMHNNRRYFDVREYRQRQNTIQIHQSLCALRFHPRGDS